MGKILHSTILVFLVLGTISIARADTFCTYTDEAGIIVMSNVGCSSIVIYKKPLSLVKKIPLFTKAIELSLEQRDLYKQKMYLKYGPNWRKNK